MNKLTVPVTEQDHIQGPDSAPITLVEYGDYECPACGYAYPIVKNIQKHFGKQLRFVFRNFPLTQIHPYAQVAAQTAEFAGDHGKFWEMHDMMYENQDRFSDDIWFEFAQTLELDPIKLQSALEKGTSLEKIQADFMGGVRSGVNGTPTFFVNGERYDGSYEFEEFVKSLEHTL